MNESKLRVLVDESVEIERQIEALESTLKEKKRLLIAEAESRADEHTVTNGGGWSWRAEGDSGCAVIVTQPAPTLKSKVDGEGKSIERIREVCGNAFPRLFEQRPSYQPVPGIREEATALLGKVAGKLIKLITTESAPRVSFETAKREE